MAEPEWEIPKDAYVRLLEQPSTLYPYAWAGSKGWVKKHRFNDIGDFPLVWIQWDREDWRVDGQPDGWYFESHFEPIKNEEKNVDDATRKQLASVAESLVKLAEGDDSDKKDAAEEAVRATNEAYAEQLEAAVDAARDAEAFVFIAVSSHPQAENPQVRIFEPVVVEGHTNEPARIMLGTQVSRLGTIFHVESADFFARSLVDKESSG